MKGFAYIYRRLSQWKRNFNVVTCEEEGAIIIQGLPGDEIFSDDIFGRVACIIEGFSGVEHFTVANEHKTAIFEDSGVGSVKDAYLLELLTGVLEASPTRSQQPSPWRTESEPEGLGIV